MVLRDERGIAKAPVVEVADDGNAARVGGNEDELNGDGRAGRHGARVPAEHPDGNHGDDTCGERGGPSGPPRDVRRGSEPSDNPPVATFGVETPHANHDAAIERFVETNWML